MAFFNTSENSPALVGLKSFLSLGLIEAVYRNQELNPASILTQVLDKIRNRYNDASEKLGGLDISLLVIDKSTKEIQFSGVNQNAYYFDEQEKMKMLNGWNESFDIDGEGVPAIKSVKAENVTEAYFISKNILNQIIASEGDDAEGTSFLQYMRSIHKKSMKDQSELISKALSGEKSKCMIGLSVK